MAVGFDFTYDRAGNRLTAGALHDSKDNQVYRYDSSGRLVGFTRGNGQGQTWSDLDKGQGWGLDGVGNWGQFGHTTAGDATTTQTRLDTSFNEYYSVGGVSQASDDNGNLTDDGNQHYVWNGFNRLVEVKDSQNQSIAKYVYDAGNRRVRKD